MLEHLSVEQGVAFLKECFRVLKNGGVLRVAMPSLDKLIRRCYEGNWRDADWLSWPEYKHVSTRAEMLNMAFREWGHQWLYDREELYRRLKEAGFEKIWDCEWGVSKHTDLCSRETRKDSLLIAEAEK
jgi:predicted SAM-dependent methyltransferase